MTEWYYVTGLIAMEYRIYVIIINQDFVINTGRYGHSASAGQELVPNNNWTIYVI